MLPALEESCHSDITLEIAASPGEAAFLLEVQDESGARCTPLTAGRIVVGTAASVDLVLTDPTVSARHCALTVSSFGVAIEDLGSKNGTFVGSARIREACGLAGTVISVGRSTLVVAHRGERSE